VKVDKIYLDAPPKIAIIDHEKKRTFVVRKGGLPDAGMVNSDICLLRTAIYYHHYNR
jgi:hypothetical protein